MSQELIRAIKERIQAGKTKEDIKHEVVSSGHSVTAFEAAYALATQDDSQLVMSGKDEDALPAVFGLVFTSLKFVSTRLSLVLLLAVPLLSLTLFSELSARGFTASSLEAVVYGLMLFAAIFYVVHLSAVLYIICHSDTDTVPSYQVAIAWVKSHIFPLAFVYILTGLVVWGGFLLFIIPGIVVMVSLYFSQYVFITEGKRGMAALVRSRELVVGRWWLVAGKVFGVLWSLFIPLIVITIVLGLVVEQSSLPYLDIVSGLFVQLITSFITVVNMHVMFLLYRSLSVQKAVGAPSRMRFVYWLMAVVGIAIIPIVIAASFLLYEYGFDAASTVREGGAIQADLANARAAATMHQAEYNSFVGVCDAMRTNLDAYDSVTCNETNEAWALAVTKGDEQWCSDTTSLATRIYRELGEAVSCIEVPPPVDPAP